MNCPVSDLLLTRRHAGGLDDVFGGRGPEVVDQRLRGVGFLGVGRDRRGEYQLLLQVARKGANEIDAGGDQDVGQEQAELSLALGDGRRDRARRGLHLGLGLHFLGDAKTIEYFRHIRTGRTLREECDRWRRQQDLLEVIRRRAVGLWRASKNDNAI